MSLQPVFNPRRSQESGPESLITDGSLPKRHKPHVENPVDIIDLTGSDGEEESIGKENKNLQSTGGPAGWFTPGDEVSDSSSIIDPPIEPNDNTDTESSKNDNHERNGESSNGSDTFERNDNKTNDNIRKDSPQSKLTDFYKNSNPSHERMSPSNTNPNPSAIRLEGLSKPSRNPRNFQARQFSRSRSSSVGPSTTEPQSPDIPEAADILAASTQYDSQEANKTIQETGGTTNAENDASDGEIMIVDPDEAAKLDAFQRSQSSDLKSLEQKIKSLQEKREMVSKQIEQISEARQFLASQYRRVNADVAGLEERARIDPRYAPHHSWTVKHLEETLANFQARNSELVACNRRRNIIEERLAASLQKHAMISGGSETNTVTQPGRPGSGPVSGAFSHPQGMSGYYDPQTNATRYSSMGYLNTQPDGSTQFVFQPVNTQQQLNGFNNYSPVILDSEDEVGRYEYNPTSAASLPESSDIKDLIDNIRPDDEEEEEDGLPKTPDDLRLTLLKHQRIGLNWLLRMENSKGKGGILADDMGLGKTIQAIALMMAHKSDDEDCKTTLIVAPVSLLRQWYNEIMNHSKVPIHIGMYHGSKKRKTFKNFNSFKRYDVIMTSYSTLANEFKLHYSDLYKDNNISMGSSHIPDHGLGGEKYASPFFTSGSMFYRIFLDEAQNIKNKLSLTSKSVSVLSAKYRFCLTGTPMQNNIDELYPIIRFLKIKPYMDEHVFGRRISVPLKNSSSYHANESMKKLRALLKAILLRRSKDSTIDGKPILTLPEKHVKEVTLKMDKDEFVQYKDIENNTRNRARSLFAQTSNFSNFLTLLLRLRQACCHVFLCELGSVGKNAKYRSNKSHLLLKAIAALPDKQRNTIHAELSAANEDLDQTEEKRITSKLEDVESSDGDIELLDVKEIFSQNRSPQAETELETNETKSEIGAKPEIDAKPVASDQDESQYEDAYDFKVSQNEAVKDEPDPLATAVDAMEVNNIMSDGSTTDKEVKTDTEDIKGSFSGTPKLEEKGEFPTLEEGIGNATDSEAFTCPQCLMPSPCIGAIRFPCGHKVCEECIEGYVKEHESDDGTKFQCQECWKYYKTADIIDYRVFDMLYRQNKSENDIVAELKRNASQSSSTSVRVKQLIIKYGSFEYSTKMEKVQQMVHDIFAEYPGEKIIIFSQFTSFLELMKIMFNEAKIPTLKYDGTMSVDQKDATVGQFYHNDKYKIMLTSLKAGNVGLTLNCASHVILMDPFWNPFVEEQAMDRAHRIGQTKEVHVYKLLVEDTVEQRIFDLQKKKKELIQSALDEKEMKSVSRLSRKDLQYLFGFGTRPDQG